MGHQASRLSHFSPIFENQVFVEFFDFGWLDMFDIAYNDSTNCSYQLDNPQLPVWRHKYAKCGHFADEVYLGQFYACLFGR